MIENQEKGAGMMFLEEENDPYEGLSDDERRARIAQETLQKAHNFVDGVAANLRSVLNERKQSELSSDIPLCTQQYGTDCGIACARMALQYYGNEDMGTDGFITRGRELGADIMIINDVNGDPGPISTPGLTKRVAESCGIDVKNNVTSWDGSQQSFISALMAGQPIEIGLPYSAIHPEDERPRHHGVIVKGFRISDSDDIQFIINDPKPEVGGEIEIDRYTLAKGLTKMFTIYEKKKEL